LHNEKRREWAVWLDDNCKNILKSTFQKRIIFSLPREWYAFCVFHCASWFWGKKIKNKMRQWSIWWPCGKCGCNKEDVFLSFIFIFLFLFNYMVSENTILTNSMFTGIVYSYLGRGLLGVKKTTKIYGFCFVSTRRGHVLSVVIEYFLYKK
jgi:hypothetical protein